MERILIFFTLWNISQTLTKALAGFRLRQVPGQCAGRWTAVAGHFRAMMQRNCIEISNKNSAQRKQSSCALRETSRNCSKQNKMLQHQNIYLTLVLHVGKEKTFISVKYHQEEMYHKISLLSAFFPAPDFSARLMEHWESSTSVMPVR